SARPRDLGVPRPAWSLAQLREYLVKTGAAPAISLESLRVALRRAGLSLKPARTGLAQKGATTMITGAFQYHSPTSSGVAAKLLALGAEIVAKGVKAERRIPIGSFFTGPFETALKPDELLVEIRVPLPAARSGGAYLKLERKVGDFATAAVAVQLTLGANGTCEQVGIGLTNVGLTPIKASRAEAALKGKRPDEATIKQAAQLAADASQPSADLRGPVEYKKDLIRVLTARALRKALDRAGGGRYRCRSSFRSTARST